MTSKFPPTVTIPANDAPPCGCNVIPVPTVILPLTVSLPVTARVVSSNVKLELSCKPPLADPKTTLFSSRPVMLIPPFTSNNPLIVAIPATARLPFAKAVTPVSYTHLTLLTKRIV